MSDIDFEMSSLCFLSTLPNGPSKSVELVQPIYSRWRNIPTYFLFYKFSTSELSAPVAYGEAQDLTKTPSYRNLF